MRVLTIAELMRLTCIELADLLIRITNALPHLAAGSAERQIAQINLRNVRSALARQTECVGRIVGRILIGKQAKVHCFYSIYWDCEGIFGSGRRARRDSNF